MSGLVAFPVQIGCYRVLRELGEGGMGTVYLAEDKRLDCRVALKVLRVRKEDGPKPIDRFYREAQLAQSIQHPYICPVYEVGNLDGLHYLTMPFVEGTPLNQLISPETPWSQHRAAKVVRRVALALEALHQRQVLHRDLKPHNIMLRTNDEPMVMDLGLGCSLGEAQPRLTTPGKTVGTPAYMPPELITGEPSILGFAADVYSLGVIFYELLTGHLPFNATNVMALFYQILSVLPPSPSSARPDLNETLVSICMRALAKSPEHRFRRMAEMAEALNGYLQQHPDSFPPTLSPSLARHPLREEQQPDAEPSEHLYIQTTETPTVPPQFVGGYDLVEKIAKGGMGSVYKARHRDTGQVVAVKLMPRHLVNDPLLLRRFEQEFRVARQLDHPNIVRALDFGNQGDMPYLVMEYVEGESLGARLDRDGRMAHREAVRVIVQVAQGLHRAHKQGLVHRDVKPDNILLTLDGIAKLADLGLVKSTDADVRLTKTGEIVGTPEFMAPEQFHDSKNADARCDIYALAATLYTMVTGEIPFRSSVPLDSWLKKIKNQLKPPRELVSELPERTEWAILRAMSLEMGNRPTSCREFVEDLTGHSTRRPTPTDSHTPISELWYLVYRDNEGVTHTVKGTTSAIRRSLKQGLLGDAGNVRAARSKAGPFDSLRDYPEFRDLVVPNVASKTGFSV